MSLEDWDDKSRSPWREILAETKAFSPAQTAAARLDIEAWLKGQSARDRSIANLLAAGERTSSVAKRFRLSFARISAAAKGISGKLGAIPRQRKRQSELGHLSRLRLAIRS